MITGHLGLAAIVHAARRGTWALQSESQIGSQSGSRHDWSLYWLAGASVAPDVVDALFAAARLCNPHGLYSHTVPAAVLIAALTGGAAFLATGRRSTGVLALALVLAHIPLDYLTGHKLFWPGDELRGLHLYTRPLLDFVLESVVVAAGWWLLRRQGRAPRWTTSWTTLIALIALQGTLSAVGDSKGGIKPSACARAQAATTSGTFGAGRYSHFLEPLLVPLRLASH